MRGRYAILIDLEAVCLAQAELRQLGFDQRLTRLRQILLNLADADAAQALATVFSGKAKAILYHHPGKEMGLARTAPAMGSLVAGRDQQRLKNPRRLNIKTSAGQRSFSLRHSQPG